jgi:transcriptional regulator with GAF, ATPase, and Fis domain
VGVRNLSTFHVPSTPLVYIERHLGGRKGTQNADKRADVEPAFISQEAVMKTIATVRGPADVKEFVAGPRPVTPFKEVTPMEMQPTFTLTFSVGTTMREIHDSVIRTILQYTRNNRLRAAQMLKINPRTIRRRLGKKDGVGATTRAA